MTPLRICVFGPESTGKTTLAAQLARHYGVEWVPEAARELLPASEGRDWPARLDDIARAQQAAEALYAARAGRLLFCDTDLLTTVLWSEELAGRCAPWIANAAREAPYDLTLLCDVDLPWVPDPVRLRPDDRRGFFERCEAALAAHGRRTSIVRGQGAERLRQAIGVVDLLLAERGVSRRP